MSDAMTIDLTTSLMRMEEERDRWKAIAEWLASYCSRSATTMYARSNDFIFNEVENQIGEHEKSLSNL